VWGTMPGLPKWFPAAGKNKVLWSDKQVVLQAYTDSNSVVPALAPGAEEAGGLVALMDVLGAMKENPVPASVIFLATSGHGHALSGSHDWLARHVRRRPAFTKSITGSEAVKVDYFISLDLSSGDGRVASFSQGTFYWGWEGNLVAQNAMAGQARILDDHAKKLWGAGAAEYYLNGVSPPTRSWKDLLGYRAAFDSEAATLTGTLALALATPFDARLKCDTPLDTPDRVDTAALSRQVATVRALLLAALSDPAFFPDMKVEMPDIARAFSGEIHEFERTVTGLPDKPVAGALLLIRAAGSTARPPTCGPVRSVQAWSSMVDDPVTLSVTETGIFHVQILKVREYWAWVGASLEGYGFDADGRINLTSDTGPITSVQFPAVMWFQSDTGMAVHVLFRTKPLTILEPVDARSLRFLDAVVTQDGLDQPFMNSSQSVVAGQSLAREDFTPAVVLFPPDLPGQRVRVKALMSTGPFGLRSIFTGADEKYVTTQDARIPMTEAQGHGYPADLRVLARAPYEGAKDLWVLDEARGRALRDHNVRSFRIEELHERARTALIAARKAWDGRRYGEFIEAARQAWGLESRAYPEFKGVADDLVHTVVFYCLLLMPFSFCMERLVFAFSDLRRQIVGTAGFFLLGFLALRAVHPAFRISSNPLIIFLAFIILSLGVIVLGIIMSKFQRELRRMKGERGDYEAVDIGRVSATVAALTLGLSNLRKRPIRTALTVVTVVVLTFTVLSLVSMTSTISFFRLPRGSNPPYTGALIREAEWQVLQPPVEEYVRSALSKDVVISPRIWVTARRRDEALIFEVTAAGGRTASIASLLGLTTAETAVTRPQAHVGLVGRWLKEGERDACLLPRNVAARLGVGPGGTVNLRGTRVKVVGTFDPKKLFELKDLDNEPVTPARFAIRRGRYDWEATTEPPPSTKPVETFTVTEHQPGDAVAIVPYELAQSMEGRLYSVALVPRPGLSPKDMVAKVKDFLVRAAVLALVSDGKSVQLFTSIGAVSVSGAFDLLVPVAIVGLIVLNTMMGSVHERVREIAIFSSVGLAPVHIGALFLAEAFVVAVVGAVLGYLVAQTAAAILLSSGTLAGLSLNYSSSAAVGACVIVIAAVMLSTIYPARRASALAVPDVTRQWHLPEPDGDDLKFDFPFTVGDADSEGMFAYLAELFRAYRDSSIGSFATDWVRLGRGRHGGMAIEMSCWLAPYDLGIGQEVKLETRPMPDVPGLNRVEVSVHRISGGTDYWYRQNRLFLTALRKRFLVWRMFGAGLKTQYAAKARAELKEGDRA
jgi:hypothetical protein